jgi:hypothetical protein
MAAVNETIRDYIKRRVRWSMAIGFAGWLVFGSGIVTGNQAISPFVDAVGALMFGGAILAMQWIKCPKCSTRLGQIGMTLAVPGLKPQPNFCPYCGVSLDEPRVRPTPAGQPIDPIS